MKLKINTKGLDIEKIQNDFNTLIPLLEDFRLDHTILGYIKLVKRGNKLEGKIVKSRIPLSNYKGKIRLAPSILKNLGEEEFTIKGLSIQTMTEIIVMSEPVSRPPIGVMPKFIYDEKRMNSLREAIERYLKARDTLPIEWVVEYNDLTNQIRKK